MRINIDRFEHLRPDPDQLLTLVKKQEQQGLQGKLKIYLGMVAGVGKTYAMLQSAHQLLTNKVDIVIGYVETHGRKDTYTLVQNLPIIPRKKISYKNVMVEEMDIDAVLRRNPKVVLVDELAHTNTPGSRHAKRYQDVLEILENGIDVHTTVNVQHVESRAHTVYEITGIPVSETMPDSMIDRADEIVLIDLAPEQVLERLNAGKIYSQENAAIATQNFFRQGNLTALRNIALRLVSERVDHDLQDYKMMHGIPETWKTRHRLMVAVYASPYSELLISWTRRMAYSIDAPWFGVFVETDEILSQEEQSLLKKNLNLVRQLGGEVVTTKNEDTVQGLLHVAQQNQVTQIVIGKSRRSWWKNLLQGGSFVQRLLKHSGDIDIYVVGGKPIPTQSLERSHQQQKTWLDFKEFFYILSGETLITILCLLGLPWIGYKTVGLFYLLVLNFAALVLKQSSIIFATLLSAVLWNFLFMHPRFTFWISAPDDWMMLIMYLVTALVVGNLTTRLRTKEKFLQLREDRVTALYNLTQKISSSQNIHDCVSSAIEMVENLFHARVGIFLKKEIKNGTMELLPYQAGTLVYDEKELGVANWVARYGKPAGRFTDTLSFSAIYYIPLQTGTKTIGVMGIQVEAHLQLSYGQQLLLENCASQLTLGIERETLHESIRKHQIIMESEKIYNTLLNCVSHELKTPLATIQGCATTLLEPGTIENAYAIRQLAEEINTSSERMNDLIQNFLDMNRLEAKKMKLNLQPCDLNDLFSTLLNHIEPFIKEHPVSLTMQDDLPLLNLDYVLMEQALRNIVHNACLYTPVQTPIEIHASIDSDCIVINIRDHGAGIPGNSPEKVFEKFFRANHNIPGGTGLGLSITKALIELHGGRIKVENHPRGGTQFSIYLHLPNEK